MRNILQFNIPEILIFLPNIRIFTGNFHLLTEGPVVQKPVNFIPGLALTLG
jgi:hypothetical protein